MQEALLESLDHFDRHFLSKHFDALGEEMCEAILNAGFAPQERQVVIKHAKDIAPKKLPLLKVVLAPLVGDWDYGDCLKKANALSDDMLQSIVNAHFTADILTHVFLYAYLLQPGHMAHLMAWCEGVPNYELRAMILITHTKTPEELACVVEYGLGPHARQMALENPHLFPEEKKAALIRLLKDWKCGGVDIAQELRNPIRPKRWNALRIKNLKARNARPF